MSTVCTVIPIYKKTLTNYERIAFDRCVVALHNYPIVIVCPSSIQLNEIGFDLSNIKITRFEDKCFSSIQSYNKLLLSKEFYQAFSDYEYILIHQLDCFVFKDDLLKWCSLDLDYIGAPWDVSFSPVQYLKPYYLVYNVIPQVTKLFRGHWVGNGGLSLRRTQSFLSVLHASDSIASTWKYNEDQFWSFYGKRYLRSFLIPNVKIARSFAFERNPRRNFLLNNSQLPFGCHAWEKWDIDFWRPIFKKYGYSI
jgi:hypothetical protein